MNSRDENQLLHSTSVYATIRKQAHAILRGPRSIEAPNLDSEPFYGWPVLSLELRTADADRVESRIIYANPLDATQHVAILRAVYWDGVLAKKVVKNQGDKFQQILPARFVKISAAQVKAWLSKFTGISIVNEDLAADETADIRRLRIEQDYLSWVLEVVWESKDQNHALLNQKWDEAWLETTQVLKTEPPLTSFYEHFWFTYSEIQYSHQEYQPDWHFPQ